jgi:eukaryotic-like serine/threonine-protein kinase
MSRTATEQRTVWCCSTCGAIYHRDYPRCPADGAEVVMADRDPLLGTAIGHYTIERLLGEGGMGRVYLAHHAHLPNKRYAVKVLLGDHSASAAMRTRFTREAERASQLDHPNVVKVVDFGQTRHGLLYIVMDHVDGPALVTLIDELPMAPARVIALTRAICQGLVYAHAAGIVHRDLKPENILVSSGPDGPVPRIVDFGLAVSIDQSDARLTESGMTMGTPAFAAPEQLAGKPVDHRADLYALGMTMFEMLTGGLAPFEGHILEVVSARTARDVPRISERAPNLGVPRELVDIVARLTRRRPADRYDNATDVIEALDRLRPPAEPRLSTEPPALPPGRRRWLVGAALAACAGGGLAWYAFDAGWGAASGIASQAAAAPASPDPATTDRPGVDHGTAEHASASATETAAAAAPVSPPAAVASPPPGTALAAAAASGATHGDPAAAAKALPARAEPTTPANRRHRPRPGRTAAHEPRAGAVAAEVRRAGAAGAALVDTAPPSAPAPKLAARRELRAQIDGVDVSGSLPAGAVQRAVERRWPAIARCVSAAPEIVIARFTIGETRRARDVRATGAARSTNACVEAAFADVRTEAAPDVGDVQVTVRIAFVAKT